MQENISFEHVGSLLRLLLQISFIFAFKLSFDFYSINDKLITSALANKWVVTRVLTGERCLLPAAEVAVLRPGYMTLHTRVDDERIQCSLC